MAYINVDEVYILDNTGLQVDMATDIPFADAGFTDAQKEQARKNIAAGGTNPNLLDNPFFTINQRAQASYTGAVFGVDRWTMTGASGSVVVNSGYLTISNAAGAPYLQRLGRELKLGKTYTASILLNDGTVNSVTFATSTQKEYVYQLGNYYFELDARSAYAPNYRFMVYGNSTWTMDIVAAKLELGTVSTLANDTPPEYGTELAKCQRYFERIKPIQGNYANFGMGYASTTTQAIIFAPMQPKRDYTYTVTASGSFRVSDSARNYTVSAVAKENGACANNTLVLYVTTTGTAMTAGTPVMFGAANSNTCYIDVSNDL